MRVWRHGRLIHAVAMLLLLWTAADLSNASLCALDNEGAATFPSTDGAPLLDSSTTRVPAQAPHHIDDCFCCSHCVDLQTVSTMTVAVPVDLRNLSLVLPSPRIFGSPLYHPPLASLQ